jgi:hypothetical protein
MNDKEMGQRRGKRGVSMVLKRHRDMKWGMMVPPIIPLEAHKTCNFVKKQQISGKRSASYGYWLVGVMILGVIVLS